MDIICIVLGILCIILFLKSTIDYELHKEEFVNLLTNNTYPCILRLLINYGQEDESIITDFSQYDEEKIVNVIWNKPEEAITIEEERIDGKLMVYQHAAIFKIGDRWVWVI